MKKLIYILASVAAVALVSSCEKDKYGATPGSDTKPFATAAAFGAELPNDPDCDATIRMTANSATTDLYYFAETKAKKEARNLAEDAYADYVIANGQKAATTVSEFDGASVADVIIKSLYGENIITVVAVNGNEKHSASTSFTGVLWTTVATGTYSFNNSFIKKATGVTSKSNIELQVCGNDANTYRFKNLYAQGKHLTIKTIDKTGTSEGNTYTYCRVPAQATGLSHASYGAISVRDLGYWQGDDGYVTDYGYESRMFKDNGYNCMIYLQTYVSAGNCGYGKDYFVPAQ